MSVFLLFIGCLVILFPRKLPETLIKEARSLKSKKEKSGDVNGNEELVDYIQMTKKKNDDDKPSMKSNLDLINFYKNR